MIPIAVRFSLIRWLFLGTMACSDDPALVRGNTQPGDSCKSTNDCDVGFICNEGLCAQTDPFRISLSWTVDTDFDLHVRTPSGELYFGRDNEQAYLGTDDCKSNVCVDPDGTHYEHAFLLEPPAVDAGAAPLGPIAYEYWVDNYGCETAGDFALEVATPEGTVGSIHTGTLPATCAESEHFYFTH
jgi:hypothetical protein